jgi:outer membrane protein assembly factor BamA
MDSLLAFRFQGFLCRGRNLFAFYYGGNNQVRSSYFYNIIATEAWFANAELRFPLANSVSTLIGNLGPFRGVLFFDITRSKLGDYPAKFYRYNPDQSSLFFTAYDEFDAIGSYGYGFEFFLWGLPIHIEFAKRLEWPSISKPFNFSAYGSFMTKFWIGFDF